MVFLNATVESKNNEVSVICDFYRTLYRYIQFGYSIVEQGNDKSGVIRQEWYIIEKDNRQITLNIWKYKNSSRVVNNQYKILGLTK